jgi:uncharacterized membrane protein
MSYTLLKAIHILAMSLFFGAGLASAIMKLRADRTGDLRVMVFTARHIVWADWLFTIPAGVVLPVSGLWMAHQSKLPWTSGWIATGILLYAVAGLCWVPAAVLQIRMRRAAEHALDNGDSLPEQYGRWTLIWIILGIPAFLAAMLTVYVMVSKQLGI